MTDQPAGEATTCLMCGYVGKFTTCPYCPSYGHEPAQAGKADARPEIAAWMMSRGYATGHGDTVADLLSELAGHVREECALALKNKAVELEMAEIAKAKSGGVLRNPHEAFWHKAASIIRALALRANREE